MRSLGWALKQGDWCPYRKRGSHGKTQAETGAVQPLAEGAPGPPGGKQASRDPPLERVEGGWACRHLELRLLASSTCGCRSPRSWCFVTAALGNSHTVQYNCLL